VLREEDECCLHDVVGVNSIMWCFETSVTTRRRVADGRFDFFMCDAAKVLVLLQIKNMYDIMSTLNTE